MQETLVQFLGWENPLEMGLATHSSILWASLVAQLVKNLSTVEGNGNPLQYSCLENSMDREVWWASPWGRKRVKT